MKNHIALLLALVAMTGCGTVANTAVAGYETNFSDNQKTAGQLALNAKIFALCLTPFSDIVNAMPSARAAIKAGCVPSSAATESTTMVETIPAAMPSVSK